MAAVSWHAAVSFCRWLATRAAWAQDARLPTEAEWEYASRGGRRTRYRSGDEEADLDRVGWYVGNWEGRGHRVGGKPGGANPFGLYDVHGNVWEWTSDAYRRYSPEPAVDPSTPVGVARVQRGGCCWDMAGLCRSACRIPGHPPYRGVGVGFRVLLPQHAAPRTEPAAGLEPPND